MGALARGSLQNVTLFEALEVLRLARDDDRIRGIAEDQCVSLIVSPSTESLAPAPQV